MSYYEEERRRRIRESDAFLRREGYVPNECGEYYNEDVLKPPKWINEDGDIEESM